MNNIVGFDEYNKIKTAFDEAKSKIDLAKRLGISTKISGSSLNKKLQKYADIIGGFNFNYLIQGTKEYKERYYDNPKICPNCGKVIPYERKDNKFCSQSCSATYGNLHKKPKSEDEKEKTSRSLLKHYGWSNEEIDKIKCGELKISKKKVKKICPVCKNEFMGKPKQVYCSSQCVHNSPEYKEKQRKIQLDLVIKGEHKGWQTRDKCSYAEKFWMGVLDLNNIEYTREEHTNKKYFLDFLIEKNGTFIDLEIDGKQHKDRIEHDKKRDEFITKELGFIVYRIPWNEINSEKGKKQMQEKISTFLEFYKNL